MLCIKLQPRLDNVVLLSKRVGYCLETTAFGIFPISNAQPPHVSAKIGDLQWVASSDFLLNPFEKSLRASIPNMRLPRSPIKVDPEACYERLLEDTSSNRV